ncbi:MAG: TonB-dependent receptor [Bacteroidota bacterium]
MKIFTFLLLTFIISVQANAHTGSIKGRVHDNQTQTPLQGVTVSIAGTNLGAISDLNGAFTIGAVPTGSYDITASVIGFKKQAQRITITASDTASLKFDLAADILMFPTIAVEADRPYSTASSVALRAIDFELRPKNSAQDLLRLAPGLVIAQHAGGGKAEQIFIRGFDADHGTDVRISVDGMPVNMVSHGHGQGYADLHFVIPETVKGIDVAKGPYFAQHGDFATAGAVSFKTFDRLDRSVLKVEGGMFGTGRTLFMMQLPPASEKTTAFVAAEFMHNDGYFQSKQDFNRYNVLGKIHTSVSDNSQLALSISGFGSAWDASGQIPERAVAAGTIDRFGSIDDTEGGATRRHNLNLEYTSLLNGEGDFIQANAFLTDYRFRLFSNFTFFARDSVNGDQIEQNDARQIVGINGKYAISHDLFGINAITTLGTNLRADIIDVELWNAKARKRLSTTVSTDIFQQSSGLFVQEELIFNDMFRMELGLRGDYFIFDLEDNLNVANENDQSGYVQQTLISPKINLVFSPFKTLRFFANAGSGFHSNDARGVATNPGIRTLPRALGAEFGTQFQLFDQLIASAVVWGLDLESELVYVGDEGVTEASGATRRVGIDVDARYQIFPWLWADAGVFVSQGRFKDLPDGENNIALAPTFTSTGGISATHSSGFEGSLRFRHVSDRPANETNSVIARGYTVADSFIGFKTSRYMIGVSVENLFNTEWNEAQFDTESRLQNETEAVSELHYTPGTPFNARTMFSLYF